MDGSELRFRLASQTRRTADRALSSLARPAWRRADVGRLLTSEARAASPDLRAAERALSLSDWTAAHEALAGYFARRPSRFLVAPQSLRALSARIRECFPDAAAAARHRADRMLSGHYDLLGYRDIDFGMPPAWHRDAVHNREASRQFWSDVPYLDSSQGDHKVIWEINRHQHWLGLARAFHLTGEGRYYSAVIAQLENWMAVNPPLHGMNWASMLEIALRSLSWLWALHFFVAEASQGRTDEAPWTVDLLLGLDRQLLHVERNLSLYFSPNTHLSGEALALYVAGRTLPEFRNSRRWETLGRHLLLQEIDRQVLADGGHAERSAHYHRYATDFHLLALLIARTTGDPAAPRFEEASRRLSHYLRAITDDNGRVPLLGDDDGGQLFPMCHRAPWDCRDTLATAAIVLQDPSLAVSDAPEETYWLCGEASADQTSLTERSRASSTALPDSGYFVSRTRAGDHLVFDAGRHGFLNGGHAHADALSLSLTVRGQPLLVDAGTATYTMDLRLRDLMRSTAMHNTVVVNGRSQAQPSGPFHWETRTDARSTMWRSELQFDYAEGRHAGYGPIGHSRGVLAIHGFGWLVVDHLLGPGGATADTMWHIHPEWIVKQEARGVSLQCGPLVGRLVSSTPYQSANQDVEGLDLYSPIYGEVHRASCVRDRIVGPLPASWLSFIWFDNRPTTGADLIQIETLPLVISPTDWVGAAFRISFRDREVFVLSAVPCHEEEASDSPSQRWGCDVFQTDGRLAVADAAGNGLSIRIGGTTMGLASSVHP